jgi:hypothetical protein
MGDPALGMKIIDLAGRNENSQSGRDGLSYDDCASG